MIEASSTLKYFAVCEKHGFKGPMSLEIEGQDSEQKSFAGKQDVMVRSVRYLKGLGVL